MRTRTGLIVLAAIALCVSGRALAAEGMWRLDEAAKMPMEPMQKAGLKLNEQQIRDLKKATIQVNYGGTGSFVSAQGLLVTNHHVGYDCIATLDALPEHKGIMDNGFAAQKLEEEISCPGFEILVVDDLKDVTADMAAKVKPDLKGAKRFEAIRLAKEDLTEACEADKKHICEVSEMDGGASYLLSVYNRLQDIRLVYAPERSLGKFGGDTDNWRFPRHTADYTFLRAYVSPAGEGVGFDQANVPYRPPAFLKVSSDGVKLGDYVMVMGFPGRTMRHFPYAIAKWSRETEMPMKYEMYKDIVAILKDEAKKSDDSMRRYNWMDWALNNALKYYKDCMDNFDTYRVLDGREKAIEAEMLGLAGNSDEQKAYKKLMDQISGIYKRYAAYYPEFSLLVRLSGWVVPSIATAADIARWSIEKDKTNRMRKLEEYKDKNIHKAFDDSDRLDDRITVSTEKAVAVYMLKRAAKLPAKDQPKVVRKLIVRANAGIAKIRAEAKARKMPFEEHYRSIVGAAWTDDEIVRSVDWMYGTTKLLAHSADKAEKERALWTRRLLFYDNGKSTRKVSDPLLDFARDAIAEFDAMRYGPYAEVEAAWDTELRPVLATKYSLLPYPDANFTLRLTFGNVADYTEAATGKTFRYITDLKGMIAKDKGNDEFTVPAKVKEVAKSGDLGRFVDPNIKDVPIDFTATLDTTGGNSGSPVLDGQGRLVGLLFDGTPESILSDWQYLEKEQRSIIYDIRFTLFLAEKVHPAGRILKELGF